MEAADLKPGAIYITTAKDAPEVRFVEIAEDFGEGHVLLNAEYHGQLILIGLDQLIAEAN